MQEDKIFNKTLYYRNIFDSYNLGFSPSIVGYEKCSRNKGIIDSNKSCYIIHFVFEGSGVVIRNNKNIVMRKGDCFLIEPNSHVKYKPLYDDPWSYFWVEVSGELIKKICEKAEFYQQDMHIHLKNFERIYLSLAEIFDESKYLSNQHAETLRVVSVLFDVFSIIISEHHYDVQNSGLSQKELQVRKIIDYINNNYTLPDISIKKIADHFYFNPAYLTRIFKMYVSVSPMKYIIDLRMRKAVELLQKNNFSISQIAYALGYKNQFYFSKEFKRHFGVQPSKYCK